MAEESILLRVGVDENQIARSEAAVIAARESIDALREANKRLADEGKKNTTKNYRKAPAAPLENCAPTYRALSRNT